MLGFLTKLFGSANERQLAKMGKLVDKINAFGESVSALTDTELQSKIPEFRQKLADGLTLSELLPEVFAVVREASGRVMGMRHFDVQLLGGITLYEGRIAEMRTGEGKTLVATLPVCLNALTGKGVHVVTVNDYLAYRDANWMRPLYEFLGLSVGVITPNQDSEEKQAAYQADVTYGTNNEFGFDYLRDNMAFSLDDKFQRPLNFAIVDEVDSILIDEARTPLIISGPSDDSSEMYRQMNLLIPQLERGEQDATDDSIVTGDFLVDEKNRQVDLTEQGHHHVEQLLQQNQSLKAGDSLYATQNLMLLHHVHAALRAHVLYQRDVDYIVQSGQVVLVDEHTGRTMHGRRLSEGLHQALEAKEQVDIQSESQTLASTTFQNYFRLYDRLSGMTGTADTEAYEFQQIYGLGVTVMPTHRPIQRQDANDLIYIHMDEKYEAIIRDIQETSAKQQPILVGTASIESSELLSQALKKHKVAHQVLNAKFHEKEAEIIAQAGKPGAVTIATNMAGRGTDIVLGGNWEVELANAGELSTEEEAALKAHWQQRHDQVLASGGLYIIGTERHESRRIDNQLRGRSGRQGDPGASRFYLSMEDNLMRIFASDRMKNVMKSLGMERGEAIEARMVSNAIEKAQRKVEGRNFDVRKQLLEYDDVANDQRSVVYAQRNDVMATDDVSDMVESMRHTVIQQVMESFIPQHSLVEQWDLSGLSAVLEEDFNAAMPLEDWVHGEEQLDEVALKTRIVDQLVQAYQDKEAQAGSQALRTFEKHMVLSILDEHWKEHLAAMDHLRQGIHLRGYAAKNPKQEYKRESFELFQGMMSAIKYEIIKVLSKVAVQSEDELSIEEQQQRKRAAMVQQMHFGHESPDIMGVDSSTDPQQDNSVQTFVRTERKVGRNEPCPCGSGAKYKHCHGKL